MRQASLSRLYRYLARPLGAALLPASTSVSHRGTGALRSPGRIKLRRTSNALSSASVYVHQRAVMRVCVRASCYLYVARIGAIDIGAVGNNSAGKKRNAHKGVVPRLFSCSPLWRLVSNRCKQAPVVSRYPSDIVGRI